MRLACIDIGSNTTRLLVADRIGRTLREIHQERAFTRIGRGLSPSGAIPEAKIDEVVAVVVAMLAIADDHDAPCVRVVATAAIRTAPNGARLAQAVGEATGLTVDVLSCEEESRLAFLGAAAMLERSPEGELGVIDVGGGSTEIVVGTPPDQVHWWASMPIGSGSLAERHLRADPPGPGDVAAARAEIAAALAGLDAPRPALAVAVGGSATSLARLAGPALDSDALARSLALLARLDSGAIARAFDVDPERARLLPAGLLILEAIASLLETPLSVGRGGIREGVLLQAVRG